VFNEPFLVIVRMVISFFFPLVRSSRRITVTNECQSHRCVLVRMKAALTESQNFSNILYRNFLSHPSYVKKKRLFALHVYRMSYISGIFLFTIVNFLISLKSLLSLRKFERSIICRDSSIVYVNYFTIFKISGIRNSVEIYTKSTVLLKYLKI